MFMAGVIACLAVLAKIQVLLMLGLHGLSLWGRVADEEWSQEGWKRPWISWALWAFTVASLGAVLWLGWFIKPHPFIATYASGFSWTGIASGFVAGTLGSVVLCLVGRLKPLVFLEGAARLAQVLLAGFFSGFWLLLALYPTELKKGLMLVAYTSRVLFFRLTELGLGETDGFLTERGEFYAYMTWEWVGLLGLLGLVVMQRHRPLKLLWLLA